MDIKEYETEDLSEMIHIWNEVVQDGIAFPQLDLLDEKTGKLFFESQTYVAVAKIDNDVKGLYILHPNNIGRCGHIGNTSYAVGSKSRGQHIGELLVKDSLIQAKEHGFKILQFNAVVASNSHARRIYSKLGFIQLGIIPGGFMMKDGHYEDICPYYHIL